MKTFLLIFTIALLINGSAATAAQTPSGSDTSGRSTGIVGPAVSTAPTLQNQPRTPTQSAGDGSVRNAELPAVLVHTVTAKGVSGTLSPRIGGWSCAGNRCTLRTTGDASPAKALQACRSFQQLALEQGAKVAISAFETVASSEQKVRLSNADLRRCMR